jgi:hypothetical protein
MDTFEGRIRGQWPGTHVVVGSIGVVELDSARLDRLVVLGVQLVA